ncbi:MAG TPA: hypothetical protein VIR56_03950 [Solimonas sp.]
MREQQFVGAVTRERHFCLQLRRQPVIRQLHLVAEDHLGRFAVLRDNAAALIGVEQRVIEPDDANQRRESELARLQDDVPVPQPRDQPSLRPIRLERHNGCFIAVRAFQHDLVQLAGTQPPHRIRETGFHLVRRLRNEVVGRFSLTHQ